MKPATGVIVPERLDLDQLRELRADIRHIMRGTRDFRFAIDAYDILRFCFPVGPFAGSRFRRSLYEHADYAAGLSFIFLRESLRPILLPEYLEEIHFFVAGFSSHYQGTYGDQELISTIESEAAVIAPDLAQLIRTPSTAFVPEEVISRYTSLLMFLSGAEAARVGFTALQQLVTKSLLSFTAQADPRSYDPTDQLLHQLTRKYEQNTAFIEHCLRVFKEIFPTDEEERDQTVLRRNYNDAVALDRVIQLNVRLDAEPQRVPQRVYLLSSSVRLQRLVSALTEDVRKGSGLPYKRAQIRVLRVPEQSFGYVIARPDVRETNDEAAGKVLDSLERLVLIYERHKTLGLERHRDPEAEREYDLLQRNMREVLAPFQESYENVALFNRLILVTKLMQQQQDSPVHSFLRDKGETGRFLRSLIDDAEVGITARTALETQRELVRFRTILTHRWCVTLEDSAAQDVANTPTPDDVRGAFHALPWLIPTRGAELARVLELARQAFFLYPDDVVRRRRKLSDAFAALIQLDSGGGTETLEDAALDLVRAVLFLALRDDTTEAAALSLAQTVAQEGPEPYRLHATYVQVWANRRSGHFDESARLAEVGTRESPGDPRFWHGRALASHARGLEHPNEFLSRQVRQDLEKALDLYQRYNFPSAELKHVTLAGCLNSLTYAWTLDVATQGHLVEARATLKRLKAFLQREQWEQGFPEFFHTEAALELHEALALPPRSKPWEYKLNNARDAARRARDLAPMRTQYRELYDQIEALLRDKRTLP
jgi:hypothetical protein